MKRISDTHVQWYVDYKDSVLLDFKVGDIVFDDLTKSKAKIIKFTFGQPNTIGVWLDNEYLGGGRNPWEVTHASEKV